MDERTNKREKSFISVSCDKEHGQLGNLQLHLQRKLSKANEYEGTNELGENVAECTGTETKEQFPEIAQMWKEEQIKLEFPEEKKTEIDRIPEILNVVSQNVRVKVLKDTLDKLLEELTESGFGDQGNKILCKAISKKSKKPLLSIFLKLLKWDLNGIKTIRNTNAGIMWRCWTCSCEFKSQNVFIRHRFIHEEQRPFQCGFCKKGFYESVLLKEHIMVHHGNQETKKNACNKIICHICGAGCRNKSYFRVHLAHHQNAPPRTRQFICDFCQKKFLCKTHIADHIRIHTFEMPFVCRTCRKSFKTKSALVRHSKSHLDVRDHQCHMCPKSFSEKMSLKRHLICHRGVKDFECECGKLFILSTSLNRHRKACQGLEKPQFPCIHCEKSFYTQSDKKSHMLTHTTTLPFQCSNCGSCLKTKKSLKRHFATCMNKTLQQV